MGGSDKSEVVAGMSMWSNKEYWANNGGKPLQELITHTSWPPRNLSKGVQDVPDKGKAKLGIEYVEY
ncbi:hypothetical protein [Paenibacillus sp. GM2]|uniref:hypothetical protein n=1 Tax=Paenibacillus sp. GM2 TaxID=1622070 RepID=UPI000AE161AC|nr:hypothetical protein [Paenibacillus sp. GM2]